MRSPFPGPIPQQAPRFTVPPSPGVLNTNTGYIDESGRYIVGPRPTSIARKFPVSRQPKQQTHKAQTCSSQPAPNSHVAQQRQRQPAKRTIDQAFGSEMGQIRHPMEPAPKQQQLNHQYPANSFVNMPAQPQMMKSFVHHQPQYDPHFLQQPTVRHSKAVYVQQGQISNYFPLAPSYAMPFLAPAPAQAPSDLHIASKTTMGGSQAQTHSTIAPSWDSFFPDSTQMPLQGSAPAPHAPTMRADNMSCRPEATHWDNEQAFPRITPSASTQQPIVKTSMDPPQPKATDGAQRPTAPRRLKQTARPLSPAQHTTGRTRDNPALPQVLPAATPTSDASPLSTRASVCTPATTTASVTSRTASQSITQSPIQVVGSQSSFSSEDAPLDLENWVAKLFVQGIEVGSHSAKYGIKLMKPLPKVHGPILGDTGFEYGELGIKKMSRVDLNVGGGTVPKTCRNHTEGKLLEPYGLNLSKKHPCRELHITLTNDWCTVERDGKVIKELPHPVQRMRKDWALKVDEDYETVPASELLTYEQWKANSAIKLSDGSIPYLQEFPQLPRQINRCLACKDYKFHTDVGKTLGGCEHDIDQFLYYSKSRKEEASMGSNKVFQQEIERFKAVKWHLIRDSLIRERARAAGEAYVGHVEAAWTLLKDTFKDHKDPLK